MLIHYSIIKISDLAIPLHPKIGIETSEIIALNNHKYCEYLLNNLIKDFSYILEDLKELISHYLM